jgi:hypothetical protein
LVESTPAPRCPGWCGDELCPVEDDCANFGSTKCQVCRRVCELSVRERGVEHYPGFKDKEVYRKTLPFIEVWLLELIGRN